MNLKKTLTSDTAIWTTWGAPGSNQGWKKQKLMHIVIITFMSSSRSILRHIFQIPGGEKISHLEKL